VDPSFARGGKPLARGLFLPGCGAQMCGRMFKQGGIVDRHHGGSPWLMTQGRSLLTSALEDGA